MKKYISFVTCVIFCFFLFGCSQNNNKTKISNDIKITISKYDTQDTTHKPIKEAIVTDTNDIKILRNIEMNFKEHLGIINSSLMPHYKISIKSPNGGVDYYLFKTEDTWVNDKHILIGKVKNEKNLDYDCYYYGGNIEEIVTILKKLN